jgi:hypothetical protein
MSIFWYKLLVVSIAIAVAVLFDIYVFSPVVKKSFTDVDMDTMPSVSRFAFRVMPTCVAFVVWRTVLVGFDTYLPSPNVYQISSMSFDRQIYIVDDYNSSVGVSFKCGSSTINLANVEIEEISRDKVTSPTAKLCKS